MPDPAAGVLLEVENLLTGRKTESNICSNPTRWRLVLSVELRFVSIAGAPKLSQALHE